MTRAHIRTGAVLVFLAVGASCSGDDAGAPTAAARNAPPTTLAAEEVDDGAPTTSVAPTDPATTSAAPVEFTACGHPGPSIADETEEVTEVSLPEGEMTIMRTRGATWRLQVSDVSDPRLEGTWYNSIDEDQYTLPGGGPGPGVATWTHRVENDEGAWQGSFVRIELPDRERLELQLVLVGEGAYEGLTAVGLSFDEPCPNTRGYIIDGSVPAPPVPDTGQ